jgi:hypothetical protein
MFSALLYCMLRLLSCTPPLPISLTFALYCTATIDNKHYQQMWGHSARLGSAVTSPYDSPVGLIEAFDRIAAGASYSSVIAAMGLQEDPATEELFQQWEDRVKLYNLDPTRVALPDEIAEAWDLPPLAPKPPNQVCVCCMSSALSCSSGHCCCQHW